MCLFVLVFTRMCTLFTLRFSNDELKCMIECEDATLDLQFSDGPAARGMERSRNQLLEENRRIARENVDKESQFFELRNRLLQLYHEGKQLKSVVEQLQENIPASNCHPPTLDTIQALLEAAAREAEDESEVRETQKLYIMYIQKHAVDLMRL